MAEYNDYMTQRAYEEGVRDAMEVTEPWEPSAEDRDWFDDFMGLVYRDYSPEEIDRMTREDIADALDEQWNWPHR